MEDKKIEAVKNWPKPRLIREIQVFIGFANFYWYFIRDFSKIAAPVTSMLKTIRFSDLAPTELETNNDKVVRGGGKTDNKNLFKKLKNTKFGIQTSIGAMGEPIFLTTNTKEAFNQLR